MLKLRVLTALILVPLMVLALFTLPSAGVGALLGVFVAAAAWEWAGLSGSGTWGRAFYVGALALLVLVLLRTPILPIVIVSVLWWLLALIELIVYRDPARGMLAHRLGKLISGAMILAPAWLASYYLHASDPRSPAALLFLFILVWVADSAAYFAGKRWGRTKLAPHVSPGKSLEGLLGGLAAVVLLAYIAGTAVWRFEAVALGAWMLLALATALFSVLGDLVESKAKRVAGVKDSGALLPGHGGVFDRIDAFTAAAPVFALGLIVFGLGRA